MTQAIVPEEATYEDTVSVALERHHRRLDEMLDRVEIDVEVGDWSEARWKFSLFRRELEEHLRIEDLMLPTVASRGRPQWWAGSIGAEHDELRDLLEVLEVLLEDEQPIGEATDILEAKLAAHNAKEESILYPLYERTAPSDAYAALAFELAPLLRSVR